MKLRQGRVRLGLRKGPAPKGGGYRMAAQSSGCSAELPELEERLDNGQVWMLGGFLKGRILGSLIPEGPFQLGLFYSVNIGYVHSIL